MEGQQVSLLPSEEEDPPPISYTKIFRDQFPYYIHLGMTYAEYWQMDCELVRAYRKAYEYKQEYDNSQLWLQGLYIYKAIEAQRPGWVFYGKKAPKPEKYLEKPIAVTKEMRQQYIDDQTKLMAEQFRAAFHKRNQNLAEQQEEGGEDGRSGSTADIRDPSQIQG